MLGGVNALHTAFPDEAEEEYKLQGMTIWFLWCLTPFLTIFQFYWWRKPEYPEKTTDLSQVMTTLSHNVVSSTPRLSRVQTHNVSGDRH